MSSSSSSSLEDSPWSENFADESHSPAMAPLGAIMASFALAVIGSCVLTVYISRRRRRLRLASRMAAARALSATLAEGGGAEERRARGHRINTNKDTRYSQIESWIVSRTILAHNYNKLFAKLCKVATDCPGSGVKALAQDKYLKERTMTCETVVAVDELDEVECGSTSESVCSVTLSDEQALSQAGQQDCPICFDDFCIGDIVSWSPNPSCIHVFHHACIKEWLLKHEGCPFCRTTFLPIDEDTMKLSEGRSSTNGATALKQVNTLVGAMTERTRPCYYCVNHGIVYPPEKQPSTVQSVAEWQKFMGMASAGPTKSELEALRGCRLMQEDPADTSEEISSLEMIDEEAANQNDAEATNQNDEQANDQNDEQVNDRNDADVANHSNQQVDIHTNEQVANHNNEQAANHNNEQVANHNNEQVANHNNEQVANHNNEQVANHNNEQVANHNNEQVGEISRPLYSEQNIKIDASIAEERISQDAKKYGSDKQMHVTTMVETEGVAVTNCRSESQ
ncbi:hypothetical protein ACA910_017573 [Epithemia clementina (nom. ined.)]